MLRSRPVVLALALTAVSLAGCGGGGAAEPAGGDALTATLMGASGGEKGSVTAAFAENALTLTVEASGLEPGLHGFHIHKTGTCEPQSADPATPQMMGAFLSAGGHLAEDGQSHGDHDGDLPSLLVLADGSARLVVTSDRLTRDNVLDADGSAVMVHEKPDNFGNVPDRYAATLDDTTKKTGDAGGRVACAVLKG